MQENEMKEQKEFSKWIIEEAMKLGRIGYQLEQLEEMDKKFKERKEEILRENKRIKESLNIEGGKDEKEFKNNTDSSHT